MQTYFPPHPSAHTRIHATSTSTASSSPAPITPRHSSGVAPAPPMVYNPYLADAAGTPTSGDAPIPGSEGYGADPTRPASSVKRSWSHRTAGSTSSRGQPRTGDPTPTPTPTPMPHELPQPGQAGPSTYWITPSTAPGDADSTSGGGRILYQSPETASIGTPIPGLAEEHGHGQAGGYVRSGQGWSRAGLSMGGDGESDRAGSRNERVEGIQQEKVLLQQTLSELVALLRPYSASPHLPHPPGRPPDHLGPHLARLSLVVRNTLHSLVGKAEVEPAVAVILETVTADLGRRIRQYRHHRDAGSAVRDASSAANEREGEKSTKRRRKRDAGAKAVAKDTTGLTEAEVDMQIIRKRRDALLARARVGGSGAESNDRAVKRELAGDGVARAGESDRSRTHPHSHALDHRDQSSGLHPQTPVSPLVPSLGGQLVSHLEAPNPVRTASTVAGHYGLEDADAAVSGGAERGHTSPVDVVQRWSQSQYAETPDLHAYPIQAQQQEYQTCPHLLLDTDRPSASMHAVPRNAYAYPLPHGVDPDSAQTRPGITDIDFGLPMSAGATVPSPLVPSCPDAYWSPFHTHTRTPTPDHSGLGLPYSASIPTLPPPLPLPVTFPLDLGITIDLDLPLLADNGGNQQLLLAMKGRCHGCGVVVEGEWRGGPDGPRSLCVTCGVHYAKLRRRKPVEDASMTITASADQGGQQDWVGAGMVTQPAPVVGGVTG